MIRDIDLDVPVYEETAQVQVFFAEDRKNYEVYDYGFFQLIEKYDGGTERYFIQIRKPEKEQLIIETEVTTQCKFQMQQPMVITWCDNKQQVLHDVGVSFLSRAACDYYWKKICKKLNLDLFTFDGEDKLKLPTQENFDCLLDTLKKTPDIVNSYIIYSEAFKKALWETFQRLRENQREGAKKIQDFMKQLLAFPDKYTLEALIDGSNFQPFLKIFQRKISLNLYKVYKQNVQISKFIDLPQEMERDVELIERIRFMKESVLSASQDIEIERQLDRLSNKSRVRFIQHFIKEKICSKIVQMFQEIHQGQDEREKSLVCRRFYQFFSEYFISFVPIQDPKLKTKIFKDFLDSGLLQAIAKIIQNDNYNVLQLFFNLANDNEALFNQIYFQELQRDSGNSLHSKICRRFIESSSEDVAPQCLIFFQGFMQYFEKNPGKMKFFSEISLPIIFSGCENHPLRVIQFCNLYIRIYNQFGALSKYIIQSDFYRILLSKLKKKEFKKSEIIEVIFLVKANLMSYGSFFLSYKKHLESPKSLEAYQPDFKPTDYKRQRKYFDEISEYTVESGLLRHFLDYLKKNIDFDNMVNSSILSLIKICTVPMKYNAILGSVRQYNFDLKVTQDEGRQNMSVRILKKYMKKLLRVSVPVEPQQQSQRYDNVKIKTYQSQLEEEKQENYLMRQVDGGKNSLEGENITSEMNQERSEEEEKLNRMREEMKKERQEELLKELEESRPQKKVKRDQGFERKQEPAQITLTFEFPPE